jgi:hypothetical protein
MGDEIRISRALRLGPIYQTVTERINTRLSLSLCLTANQKETLLSDLRIAIEPKAGILVGVPAAGSNLTTSAAVQVHNLSRDYEIIIGSRSATEHN